MTSARRKRSMCAGSHGSRATRSSAMTRASAAWFAARYASVSCSCASYIGCSRPPSTQTSTSLSSAGICPGTRATKSCRLVAASWNSAVAVAASTAASMHANVVSAFDSTNDHPSVDTSPRRDGSAARSRPSSTLARDISPERSSISASGSSSAGSSPALSSSRNSRAPARSPCPSAAFARIDRASRSSGLMRTNSLSASMASEVRPFSTRSSCSALKRLPGFLFLAHLLERCGRRRAWPRSLPGRSCPAGRRSRRRHGDRPSRGGARRWRSGGTWRRRASPAAPRYRRAESGSSRPEAGA